AKRTQNHNTTTGASPLRGDALYPQLSRQPCHKNRSSVEWTQSHRATQNQAMALNALLSMHSQASSIFLLDQKLQVFD
ncbi:hypothetical protein, partial [Chromobacterium piscinae]|uniref:hypothetical protein n=1 Tax=Chromobacterium piscinae TaxID=686831 RepID=UPI00326014DA